MLTPIQMTTVAARLRKPHSPYVAEAAADALDELAKSQTALVEALKACLQMARTAKPRKLDEALSWVENDEKAREMARAALALAEPTS